MMIKDIYNFKPRYNEVDQMGYMYHANYVTYSHIASTELLRKYGIQDSFLEKKGYMILVTDMNLKHKQAAHYDEEVIIETSIKKEPIIKCEFHFQFKNNKGNLLCEATSTIVFMKIEDKLPIKVPEIVMKIFKEQEVHC